MFLLLVLGNFLADSIQQGASLVAQLVKNLPAMQDTWVRFVGWEDPLEKEMATQSRILAWEVPWTGESGGFKHVGLQESDINKQLYSRHYTLTGSSSLIFATIHADTQLSYFYAHS